MPLRLLEPPRTLPRGHWCTSPPLCCCGVVSYAQSTSVPHSAGHIGGWWMASSVSGPPASSTRTRASACSDSRAATAHPADPAPITTWSTCDDDMASPLSFGRADTNVCARMSATATVPRPASVDGRRIEAVEVPGDAAKRPLVLLHEGLGSGGLWRAFPAALHEAPGRRVLAFSRFGHGRSDPPGSPRTPAFFHEEALEVLPELLPQLDASDPILVGHSDGGSIALIHAAYHPVTALALIAPHVFVEDVTVEEIRRTRELYESGELRARMARHHDDPDAAFFGWCDVWLDPAFRDWNIESAARGLPAPALLIQGADDPYGSLAQIDRIAAGVRGPVERLVVEGAGHSPHLEAPEPVLGAVAAVVARVPCLGGGRRA